MPSQEKRPDVQAKEPNPENRLQRGRISSGTIVSFQNVPFESTRIPSTSEQEIVSVAVTHQGAKPKKNKKNPKRPPISQIFDVRLASLSPAQNIPEPTQNTLILPESPVNILDSMTQIPSLSVTYKSPLFSIVDKPAKRGRKKRVMNITDSSVDDSRKIKRRRLAEMAAENLVEETTNENISDITAEANPVRTSARIVENLLNGLPQVEPLRRSARILDKTSSSTEFSSFLSRKR